MMNSLLNLNLSSNLNNMLMIFIYLIMMMTIFIKMNPLILSIMFIIFTLTISINLSIILELNFFSYLLYLSMIGGMMIIFMYFSSLNNSIKFYFEMNWKKNIFMTINLFLYLWFNLNYNNFDYYLFSDINNMMMNKELIIYLKQFFIKPENKFMIFSISYLLLNLICSIKICKIKHSPLRKFKNA